MINLLKFALILEIKFGNDLPANLRDNLNETRDGIQIFVHVVCSIFGEKFSKYFAFFVLSHLIFCLCDRR